VVTHNDNNSKIKEIGMTRGPDNCNTIKYRCNNNLNCANEMMNLLNIGFKNVGNENGDQINHISFKDFRRGRQIQYPTSSITNVFNISNNHRNDPFQINDRR
jgi:hypothetical protein